MPTISGCWLFLFTFSYIFFRFETFSMVNCLLLELFSLIRFIFGYFVSFSDEKKKKKRISCLLIYRRFNWIISILWTVIPPSPPKPSATPYPLPCTFFHHISAVLFSVTVEQYCSAYQFSWKKFAQKILLLLYNKKSISFFGFTCFFLAFSTVLTTPLWKLISFFFFFYFLGLSILRTFIFWRITVSIFLFFFFVFDSINSVKKFFQFMWLLLLMTD